MKKIIASALVATAAFAGVAHANVSAADVEQQIAQYAPNADLSGLSTAELNAVIALVHSGDNEGEKRQAILAFIQ